MSAHHQVAQQLAATLSTITISNQYEDQYRNDFGRLGRGGCWHLGGLRVHFSRAEDSPTSPDTFARVLLNPDWIDETKSVVYRARRSGRIGIRIELWRDGVWYHVFIPIRPSDRNHPLIARLFESLG